MKILIIEDSAPVLENLGEILEFEGYDVEGAINGERGLKMLRTEPFDLLISDIKLPDISGLDILQMLRRDPELKQLQVLLVSAHQDVEISNDGLTRFLRKPFKIPTLICIVEEMLRNKA